MIVKEFPIIRYKRGEKEYLDDPVIAEEWLDLYVNGMYAMGTPVIEREIEELIYGYLFMEGYLDSGERIPIVKKPTGYFAVINKKIEIQSIKELVDCAYSKIISREEIDPLPQGKTFIVDSVLDLVREFQKLPSVYHETGGVHMAAFAANDGISFWADDISRRNALDKVLGKMFLSNMEGAGGLVLTSGRVSSDVVLRLMRAKIPVVVSISAPTVKAVELAESYGITLCGFARGRRMNVYTHPERMTAGAV